MDAEDFEFALSQYLDGTLSAEERATVEARLQADPAARALLEEYRALDVAVRKSAGGLPEIRWDRFAEHVSRAIDELPAQANRYSIAWVRRAAGLAIAASVLVVIGIFGPGLLHRNDPTVAQKPIVQPAPETVVQVSGPQAEMAAGPSVVEVAVGRPQGPGVAAYSYGDSVLVQRPVVSLASAMTPGSRLQR